MTEFEQALANPSGIFKTPNNLLEDSSLNKEQKIKILQQWEYDIRDMLVAEEENMPGSNNDEVSLSEVMIALETLGVTTDSHSPTKQGG